MARSGERWKNWREIDALDPETDYARINSLFMKDFEAALTWMALEGYGATYSIPTISRILIRGQLYSDIDKRLIDSALLTGTMYACGFGPGEGREAGRRMNQMHKMYPIKAEDFIFASSLEVTQLIRFAERFGWRNVHPKERQALVRHAVVRSKFMNILPVPETFEATTEFYDAYLDQHGAFEPQNKMLADVLVEALMAKAPRAMRPLARRWLISATDPRILRAVGYRIPNPTTARIFNTLWRTISRVKGPGKETNAAFEAMVKAQYPDGYKLSELGSFAPGKCPLPHPDESSATRAPNSEQALASTGTE